MPRDKQGAKRETVELPGFHRKYIEFGSADLRIYEPFPGALEAFDEEVQNPDTPVFGSYRGRADMLKEIAGKLSRYTGAKIDPERELILTPGSVGATVMPGDRVAVIQPDYFDYHKSVEFLQGECVPVPLHYKKVSKGAGIDFAVLEEAFKKGARFPVRNIRISARWKRRRIS